MELKFKVGDKVRIIGGYYSKKGLVGEVVGADFSHFHPYDVVVEGHPGEWILAESELEIAGGENGDA